MGEKDFHLKRPLLRMDILLLYIDITGYPLSECRIWAMISFLSFLILFCQILASVSGLSSSLQAQQPRCNSRKEAELLESAGQALCRLMFDSLHGAFHVGMH